MNDRLFRVAIILSVFALMGMGAAGTAAAQPDFNVTNLDAPLVAPFNDEVDVTVTVENEGSGSAAAADVTFAADADQTPGSIGPGSDVTGPSDTTSSLLPGESDTLTFSLNTSTNYPGLTDGNTSNDIRHGVFVNESGTSTVDDTAAVNFTVGTDSEGSIRIQVEDQDPDDPQPVDTTVEVFQAENFNSISDPGPVVRELQTGSNGIVVAEGLAVGENETLSEDYVVVAARNDPAFVTDRSQAELFEPGQNRDDVFISVERIVLPDEIQVIQNKDTALGDGNDQITFDITVWGSVRGEPAGSEIVEDAEVRLGVDASRDNGSVTVVNEDTGDTFNGSELDGSDPPTFQTGDGLLNLTTTSSTNQEVEYTFTTVRRTQDVIITGPNRLSEGLAFENPRVKNFILQGEGQVIGDVWDASLGPGPTPEHSLPDAKVWAHQKSRVTAQSILVPNGSTTFGYEGFEFAGNDSFYQLVETEDPGNFTPTEDEILDVTQDYRIDNNGQNINLSISRVRELDTNDSTVGSGFAVRANSDTAGPMFVTPLEPGFYYLRQSDNKLNASDQRFVDDTEPDEAFSTFSGGGSSVSPISRSGNLTFARAQEISSNSGQQLWDITDENGEYILQDMFTDFQAGVDYTLFANKPGFEIEFVDAFVAEDGAFFENGEDENFGLERVEQDPDVNITNIARFDDLSDADDLTGDPADPASYGPFNYTDQSDQFNQTLPRDGRTTDVVLIETFIEGTDTPVSDTVQLSIPDLRSGDDADEFNFTGEWVAVAGADSFTLNNDTATVTTGADGQAIAWLQTDRSTEDLTPVPENSVDTDGQTCGKDETFFRDEVSNGGSQLFPGFGTVFEGIVAQSQTNFGAIDASCKDFRGTITLQSAELSGIVTNQVNDPVEARVWLEEIQLVGGTEIQIVRNGADDYSVFHIDPSTSPVTVLASDTNVTADALSADDDIGGDTVNPNGYTGFASGTFPGIGVAGGATEGLTLLTDSREVGDPATEDSSYTLPRVPAETFDRPPATAVVPTGRDAQGNRGTGISTPVEINRTSTRNIEITTAPQGGVFNVTDVDAPDTVNETETFTANATVRNDGGATVTKDVDYELRNATTGNVVRSDTASLTLGGGETGFAEFSVDTSGLAPGDYINNVTTADDTQGETDPTEIVATGGNGGTVSSDNPFGDQNNNPESRDDVIDDLISWNNDGQIDGESFTRQEIINFLIEWNNAQS